MKKKHFVLLWLLLIFGLGLFLRIYHLDTLPYEMHRDEMAIGYNSYSILETGFDEHGEGPWPLIFKSFGDYKLPGLIYLSMPFINYLGLSTLAVRLPTALFSSLLILITYGYVNELFKSKKLALVASGLLAISQWHTFLARTAYEPMVGLTFSTLGIWFFFKAKKSNAFAFLAVISLSLSFLVYNLPLLLLPIWLLYFGWLYKDIFFNKQNNYRVLGPVLILLFSGFMLLFSQVASSKSKTTFFNDPDSLGQLQIQKDKAFLAGTPQLPRLISYNKYYYWSDLFIKNYLNSYNPGFLFFKGGSNAWHSLENIGLGNFSIAFLPLILVGIGYSIKYSLKKSKAHQWILGMALLSPIPASITIDSPVTNRLLDFHYYLTILAAIGLIELLKMKSSAILKMFTYFIISFIIYSWLVFVFRYFYAYNHNLNSLWNPGFRSAVSQLGEIQTDSTVLINSQSVGGKYDKLLVPYIGVAFYTQANPNLINQQNNWANPDGFWEQTSFDKYYFNSGLMELIDQDGELIYLTRTNGSEIPPEIEKTELFAANYEGQVVWRAFELIKVE